MPHAALCVSRLKCFRGLPVLAEFQCRTQHCVCRDMHTGGYVQLVMLFQCRTQHCVCRDQPLRVGWKNPSWFQCRTQHCVCRDVIPPSGKTIRLSVSMPHAALCVSRRYRSCTKQHSDNVSMPHAALCVSRPLVDMQSTLAAGVSMPHAALCVSRL